MNVVNPVPDFVPQIISLSGVGAHRIAINWTVPVEKNIYPPIDGYLVYTKRPTEDANFAKTIVDNISTENVVIVGLEERSQYEFRVAAFNTGGQGPLSDSKEATTQYEQFSAAAYTSDWQISGWEAALITGCLAALLAIICLVVIVIQHHHMKKRDSVSFVKPSQALSRFYLQNPNVAYYPDGLLNGDGSSGYDNLAYGDGSSDDYVQFIKANWNRDVRLGTLSSKDGSEVLFNHVNPAFDQNEMFEMNGQDDLLHDLDTEIHQPRRQNSITADSGVTYDLPSSISDGDLDGNFILLPKPDQVDRTSKDREHATQEVKIDFPDDTSLSSSFSYGSNSMRRTNDMNNLFKRL
ncbi:uncharacterized protein LOC121392746 [Gigantopelta aegis]|uniref:uncharacterized protein LOC121392746 n=1 Tax=Gigantopelta aegis TaxID=1735272 RepID=UPI001B8874C5|nr:uncharacterized protein LOC121392746 [Gigantopelta aegis]